MSSRLCRISLCMCPRRNRGDPLGYGGLHGIVSLISLGARPIMEYGLRGIKKTEGGLDSRQSTSVLQGVRCVSSLGLPSRETDFHYLCAKGPLQAKKESLPSECGISRNLFQGIVEVLITTSRLFWGTLILDIWISPHHRSSDRH